jgi:hypothetical protein
MAHFSGQLVVAQIVDGPSIQNQDKLQGRVALVKSDDTALLIKTALAAQNAGAIAVVLMMNGYPKSPSKKLPNTSVRIPVVMASSNDSDSSWEQKSVYFAGK